jgi:homoserine dehydrogenase
MEKNLKIGLFGFGCVGSGLYEVLNRSQLLDARIKTIVVKDRNKKRSIPASYFSFEAEDILGDPEINVVAELINDSEAAFEIVKRAFRAGKNVVSANKKLIAEHLDELLALANENGVSFLYEAAVAGSIPIIRNLEEYYNNDSLSAIQGIINGTSNYILTQSNEGISYQEALDKAQELGFAEIDPTLDVEGFDSRFKLSILIKHAFGPTIAPEQIPVKGISGIRKIDLDYAKERNYRIKLLARAERIGDTLFAVVAPHFVDSEHFTYNVSNEFNAVVVEALFSDKQLFIGKGAGSYPTASAVLSDISALKFDYNYEYRKSERQIVINTEAPLAVKLMIAADNDINLNDLGLFDIEERYSGVKEQYVVGKILTTKLKDLFARKEISLTLFNDAPTYASAELDEQLITNQQFANV